MSRGTPEDDLDTHMDRQDQAEAEHDAELEAAEETAWALCNVIKELKLYYLDNQSTVDLDFSQGTVNITIDLTEVELEVFSDYLRNTATKYVCEKVARVIE
jgi:hypothetical protein